MKPLDILVCINDRKDLFSKVKRWAMGRYEHVEMYLGVLDVPGTEKDIPMLYETDNRGVVIQTVKHKQRRHVRVMRFTVRSKQRTEELIQTAVDIASESSSYYDWKGLVKFAALRVLREKFGVYRPLLKYKRDRRMICSEAVAEVFWRNGMLILPKNIIPVPADFANPTDKLAYIEETHLK
mgnify:CR=1 FL=1